MLLFFRYQYGIKVNIHLVCMFNHRIVWSGSCGCWIFISQFMKQSSSSSKCCWCVRIKKSLLNVLSSWKRGCEKKSFVSAFVMEKESEPSCQCPSGRSWHYLIFNAIVWLTYQSLPAVPDWVQLRSAANETRAAYQGATAGDVGSKRA